MVGEDFGDLIAFMTIVREGSFTKAAAKLGVSQPALSHRLRTMEEQLGLRLLTRTTRSYAPTEAGQRLMATVGPYLAQIEAEMASLGGDARQTRGDGADYLARPRRRHDHPAETGSSELQTEQICCAAFLGHAREHAYPSLELKFQLG